MLLLHGFPQTRLTWRSVAPRLAERFRVVCPDLPGYGESARLGEGVEAFDKARVAAHLVELMRTLGHPRFTVVGQAGRRLDMPTLAAWQDPGDRVLPLDPKAIWSTWAADPRTEVLPCGHFLPEKCPEEIIEAIAKLLSG